MIAFRSFLQAGFECAHLPFGRGDLLTASAHTPDALQAAHYRTVKTLGVRTVRDGLPWRHDPAARLAVAAEAAVEAIWDLTHFDPPPDPFGHAMGIVEAVKAQSAERIRYEARSRPEPLWVCPMNEPTICASFHPGFSPFELAQAGIDMLAVLKTELPDVRVLTTDPINGAGEAEYAATDLMVSTGLVDVVGVNTYPHTLQAPLRDVLTATWKRYGLPVLLSETSWHVGHPEHDGGWRFFDKRSWFEHVLGEVRRAQVDGAEIVGVCWYPATDTPAWDGGEAVWDNGLVRLGGAGVDEGLAGAFREFGRVA